MTAHSLNAYVPLIRWAGSKRQLLPSLREFWSDSYERYVEPFAGSATLFFAIAPKSALLADLNCDLIQMYSTLQVQPRRVYLRATAFARSEEEYYRIRALDPTALDPVERAARFLYLNRFCFNGLYRTNRNGAFNVPYSPAKSGRFPDWSKFAASATLLSSAVLYSGDFEAVLQGKIKPGDFVYMDPPYVVSQRRVFRQYGPKAFTSDDLPRIKRMLDEIADCGGSFVLSYAECPEAVSHFSRWPSMKVSAIRNISGFSKHRRKAEELLFWHSAS